MKRYIEELTGNNQPELEENFEYPSIEDLIEIICDSITLEKAWLHLNKRFGFDLRKQRETRKLVDYSTIDNFVKIIDFVTNNYTRLIAISDRLKCPELVSPVSDLLIESEGNSPIISSEQTPAILIPKNNQSLTKFMSSKDIVERMKAAVIQYTFGLSDVEFALLQEYISLNNCVECSRYSKLREIHLSKNKKIGRLFDEILEKLKISNPGRNKKGDYKTDEEEIIIRYLIELFENEWEGVPLKFFESGNVEILKNWHSGVYSDRRNQSTSLQRNSVASRMKSVRSKFLLNYKQLDDSF